MVQLTKQDQEDIEFDGIMRLVEGIILGVLDQISISGKWYPRDISLITLESKRQKLEEMRIWFKDDKWTIWLDIYCEYHGYNQRHIKHNFEQIRRKSVKYVNSRIKAKVLEVDKSPLTNSI